MPDHREGIQAAIDAGDARAAELLLPIVYEQLRLLAQQHLSREAPGNTLQATALVHEVYLRLLGPQEQGEVDWNGSRHFYGAAALAMRRILVERARARKAIKRGGDHERLELDPSNLTIDEVPPQLLDLDEALDRLAVASPAEAELVRLRFFGGLTQNEAAAVIGISSSTADRYWTFARAWLLSALKGEV